MYLADYLLLGFIAYAVFCFYYCARDLMMFLGILGSAALIVGMSGAVSDLTEIEGSAAALLVFLPSYAFLSIAFLLWKDDHLARKVRCLRKAKRQENRRNKIANQNQHISQAA